MSLTCRSDVACGSVYILQRYSHVWSEFVDVTDIHEIIDSDHLKVVPLPSTMKPEVYLISIIIITYYTCIIPFRTQILL